MNSPSKKTRNVLINLFTAVAISLVVNFSNFIFILAWSPSNEVQQTMRMMMRPSYGGFIIVEILFFILLAFILLSISTTRLRWKKESSGFVIRVLICLAITMLFYFLAPKMNRMGELIMQMNARRFIDPTLILKCSLTLIVALLYGKIYDLIYQRQNILYENEVLKNENLQATYSSLVNQINPHFFFNSLNSLSMLVRGKQNDKALDYIDRLSDSFRYIIRNGHTDITTLGEELKFLDAYTYMLDIRYEGKIFFETDIDPKYESWRIPKLSLQPLVENAVKHNSITRSSPLTIAIRTANDTVIVSNPVKPRIETSAGTGTGLKNLAARYALLTGREITVRDEEGVFEVTLPLTAPTA